MWMVTTLEFYGIYGNVSWSGMPCAWRGVFGVGTLPGMALSGRRSAVRWYVSIKCLFLQVSRFASRSDLIYQRMRAFDIKQMVDPCIESLAKLLAKMRSEAPLRLRSRFFSTTMSANTNQADLETVFATIFKKFTGFSC